MLIVATAVFLPMLGRLQEPLPPEGGNIDYLNEPNFTGAVVSVFDNGAILIKTDAGNPYPDTMLITSPVIAGDEFFVGDIVTVYYDGMLMESYPVQINTPHAIELISRDRRMGDYYADEWVFDAFETYFLNTLSFAETFIWTNGRVSAAYGDEESGLFSTEGIIGSIFVADLTNDGKIDFIYLYSDGSYEYIMLYDYVNDTSYSIMNIKDTYRLSLDNGKIMVNETNVLAFVNGELTIISEGVDALPPEQTDPPQTEYPPTVYSMEDYLISISMPVYEYPTVYITPETPYEGYLFVEIPMPQNDYPFKSFMYEDIFHPAARYHSFTGLGGLGEEQMTEIFNVMYQGYARAYSLEVFEKLESVNGYDIYKFEHGMNDYYREMYGEETARMFENRREYMYLIFNELNIILITFQPEKIEDLVWDKAAEGEMFDEMMKNISIMPSVSYLFKFIMALPSGDSDSVEVIHDTRVMERYEAAKLAELTVDIVNLLDGNVMYMSSNWLGPWADLYGGKKLESINQIDIIYMYKADGNGAVFQVIAHCEFDIDDGRNEVGIEYAIVDIGGGGATGNLEWQVLDIYFVK